ncbi:methyltransferase domain-containing protein [Desulfovibrio sp. ZJ200]|uniref:class I SAM-dependent methyltransferase n=1 Tax=Desulfovibrio sp. ZJ200 TaxID=2709792 RepID=UPI0013EE28E9|nr:methyltransferase domain-containing protein [Desulfovibrio sp. ZJ200]
MDILEKHINFYDDWKPAYYRVQEKRFLHTVPFIKNYSAVSEELSLLSDQVGTATHDAFRVKTEKGSALELGSIGSLFLHYLKHVCHYKNVFGTGVFPGDKKIDEYFIENDVLCEKYSYKKFNLDFQSELFPCADNFFDFVLCMEVIEHLNHNPYFLLKEINRLTRPYGMLLLTTPNVNCLGNVKKILTGAIPMVCPEFNIRNDPSAIHTREYSIPTLNEFLEHAGFKPVCIKTVNSFSSDTDLKALKDIKTLITDNGYSIEYRGDNILILAQKLSLPKSGYPALYV